MAPSLVSVVVPSYGGVHRLPVLLKALKAQRSAAWEAIVVIDGDTDGSAALLDSASSELPVRRVAFDVNQGRSAALNAGFAMARGDVLVRCDDDLIPRPHYAAQHLAAHSGHEVGVVGLYRNLFPDTTYARVYGRDWDRQFRQEAYQVPQDAAWRYWAGNASVTRDVWEQVGPYDEAFRSYGWEDIDWGYRLAKTGVPIVLDPELETDHRIAATTTAMRTQRAFYSGAARRKFESKHGLATGDEPPASAWERAVAALATGLNENRAQCLGSLIDCGARVVPTRLAGRAVAMAVQASAMAGHHSGSTAGAI